MKTPLIHTLATLALLASAAAHADDYAELLNARRYAEVERLTAAKLARDPSDADALVARNKVLLSIPDNRFDEAAKLGETCVAAHPQDGRCHLALGNALGAKALAKGIMSALGSAGTIRTAFQKAVELDPTNIDARFSLMQYYLQAPGFVGGSRDKAMDLIKQTATVNAEAARLMQATVDMMEGRLAQAEAAALALKPGNSDALADRQAGFLFGLGANYVNQKKLADAERMFKALQQRYPTHELTYYGNARLLQEQGRHREALPGFEQALAIVARPHIYYQIARSQQAVGENAKASANYLKALSFRTGLQDKQRDDAEAQLKKLKG